MKILYFLFLILLSPLCKSMEQQQEIVRQPPLQNPLSDPLLEKAISINSIRVMCVEANQRMLETRLTNLQAENPCALVQAAKAEVHEIFKRKKRKTFNRAIGASLGAALGASFCYFYAKHDTKWWRSTFYPAAYYSFPFFSVTALYQWYRFFTIHTPEESDYLKHLQAIESAEIKKVSALPYLKIKNEQ